MLRLRRFLLPALALLGPAVFCRSLGAAGLDEEEDFRRARQALSEGLSGVAATKAERLLKEKKWSALERQTLASLAVEAWVRDKNGRAALEVLARETVPNRDFWEAQAAVMTGDMAKARGILEKRLDSGEATNQEKLLLAQTWLILGEPAPARELLKILRHQASPELARRARLMQDEMDLDSDKAAEAMADLDSLAEEAPGNATVALLRAQGMLKTGRAAEAEQILSGLLTSSKTGENIHHAAAVQLAEAKLSQGKTAEGVESLVLFLDNTLETEMWSQAFDRLARALAVDPAPMPPPDQTLRWITEGNTVQRQALQPPAATDTFRGHAMLLLARWLISQNRVLEGLGLLEAMIQKHPGHPQGAEAMSLALEYYGQLKADRRVSALAAQWRQRYGNGQSALVDFVTGGTAFARKDYGQALELFQSAASIVGTLGERRTALYNASIAALRAGQMLIFQSLLGQLEAVSANATSGDTAADLELAAALDQAARSQSSAADNLRSFIRKYPSHTRLYQAQLALAEVLLMQSPINFSAVETALRSAGSQPALNETQQQRLALTRMWMLDRQGQLKPLVDAGADFLQRWPQAPAAVEVKMKVADAYYRLENFASARTEFEIVAQEYSTSPYAETALYFAGMSAISMMSDEGREAAISLWQELAERGGPLSIAARQQQALAKRRAGQEAEALKVLDSLLTEKNLPEEMRYAIICERAEILMLLGKTAPAQLDKAAVTLRNLLKEHNLNYLWTARAGYTLAAVLNAAGLTTEALEACSDVVQASGFTGPATPAEYRWYYRAGFFGIELLEASKQWEPAARMAEKLANSSGERAAEARELATRIRLEHFLWDSK